MKGAVRIYSEKLGTYIWVIEDEAMRKTLRRRGITGAIYSKDELSKLKGLPTRHIEMVHHAKEEFGGEVLETRTGVPAPIPVRVTPKAAKKKPAPDDDGQQDKLF